MNVVIYGSQAIAYGTYKFLKRTSPDCKVLCFLVTEMGINPKEVDGVVVRVLKEFAQTCSEDDKQNIKVLIATPETVMEEIESGLKQYGFDNIVRIDSKRFGEMQGKLFASYDCFKPLLCYPVGNTQADLHVYKAKFYKDKVLKTNIELEYDIPIQVGAALTDVRVADVLDCDGDNISDRNGNYSELTGLYWIWKNQLQKISDEKAYVGLSHYRRFLNLPDDDMLRIADNDLDAILPYPMSYYPNIEEHHKRYLADDEWSAVLKALRELQPEYAEAYTDICKQEYFYNYNIVIAKETVLKEYCEWLFPILFRVEEINNPDGKKKANRYIGYVGETLETLYFMFNRDKLKIAHTGCIFLT